MDPLENDPDTQAEQELLEEGVKTNDQQDDDQEPTSATADDGVLRFSLARTVVPVILEKPDGSEWELELCEMSGAVRDAYLNKEKDMRNPNGIGFRDFKGVQATLLTMTLRDKKTRQYLKMEHVQRFPSRTQSNLYKKSCEINGLTEDAEEKAKKP